VPRISNLPFGALLADKASQGKPASGALRSRISLPRPRSTAALPPLTTKPPAPMLPTGASWQPFLPQA